MNKVFEDLRKQFKADEIEWRVNKAGYHTSNGPWAMVVAYVTNRAIMERLDSVVGFDQWQNTFQPGPDGGVLCGIGIRISSEWIWKYDGAPNTDIESVKGGLSDAMKRAAVQWGIGRYLYGLEAAWANFNDHGKYRTQIKDDSGNFITDSNSRPVWFKWDPPRLPDWALPKENRPNDPERVKNGKSAILALLEENQTLFTDAYIEAVKLDAESARTEEQVENLYREIKKEVTATQREERKEEALF